MTPWRRWPFMRPPAVVRLVLVAAAVAAAASAAAPGQTARRPWPVPRTLVEVGNLAGFAQDGTRIVWNDTRQPCWRQVQLRDLETNVTRSLVRRDGRTCGPHELGGYGEPMVLAGERALWSYFTVSLSHYQFSLYTAAPGSRESRAGGFEIYGGFEDADDTPPAVPMAGDGRTLVYAGLSGEYSRTHVVRVTPKAVVVPNSEGTIAVGASRRRFAVARYLRGWCRLCGSSPQWSPDGSKLTVIRSRRVTARDDAVDELRVVDADGRNERRLVSAADAYPIGWSRDGTSVYYTDGSGIIGVVDLAGRTRRLTNSVPARTQPVLSPDGARLAYGTAQNELRVHTIATGDDRVAATSTAELPLGWVGWSPDSGSLAFLTGPDRDRGAELRLVHAAGGPSVLLATMDIRFPAVDWAPSGREIAFERETTISAVAIDTGIERTLARVGGWSFSGWSPDGSSVAYWRSEGRGREGLFVSAADGTGERRVGSSAYPYRQSAHWSPDSAELAYEVDDRGTIYVARASGGGERRLVRGAVPIWSPSAARLAYVIPYSDSGYPEGEIGVVARDGSDARVVAAALTEPDRYPVETRAWKNGAILRRFVSSQPVLALSFHGNRVALLVGDRARKRVEIRRTSGRLLRTVAVSRDAAPVVSMAGRWVVFRTGRAIRVLDLRSGRTSTLARAEGYVLGLSIEGRRVAWGEIRRGADRIRAVVLPP